MAKGNAGNGTNHNNSATACPNSGGSAHTSSVTGAAKSLTEAQRRPALARIDIGPASPLHRNARYRAWTADIDADDLLQEAILRAMTSRSCPGPIKIEHFLMGVMRSIASAVVATRERRADALSDLGHRSSSAPVAPDEAIEFAERAKACRRAVERIVDGSPIVEVVLDGIDRGLCGKALADHAETDRSELANLRRMIKRRDASAWLDIQRMERAA